MARGDTLVELDFFRIEKEKAASFPSKDQKSTVGGIQSLISRINPQILRSVIASGAASSTPPPPRSVIFPSSVPPLSALDPSLIRLVGEISNGAAPLTIFYNGTVAVFDLPPDKAEVILKLAAEEANEGNYRKESLPEELRHGDLLPIARRKSLQRFLEKRKQRLTATGPYVKDFEGAGSATQTTSDLCQIGA